MYEKYSLLLEKVNKTSYQISKETGISQTAFSNWKSGRSEWCYCKKKCKSTNILCCR